MILVVIELILLGLCGSLARNIKAVFSLAVFAVFLAVVQLLGGGSLESAYVTGLRMLAMTIVFIILLTTTRLQDLTAALVKQIKIPYEYAFMFTAALRFVPDSSLKAKPSRKLRPAGGCRRKAMSLKKVINYMSVVQPLMLKSLGRSETMALSLELRGFGSNEHSFMSNVRPKGRDYVGIVIMLALSCFVVYLRLQGLV